MRHAYHTALTLLAFGITALASAQTPPSQEAPKDGSNVPAEIQWRSNAKVHNIAIEALVIEINEERTRDIGLHYGVNQLSAEGGVVSDTSSAFDGADIGLGRSLSPVRVPVLLKGLNGETDVSYDSTRLPGLGVNLSGMNLGSSVISARVRALLESGDASIRTRTVAIALNNTTTEIKSTQKIPYLDVKANTHLAVNFEDVGVKMNITPRIKDLLKRTTTLNIHNLEVSSVSSFITNQNVDRPVFTTSNTTTDVNIRDGETFVIGGLKSRRTLIYEQRVPILGRIWGLGWFFKSQEQQERVVDVLFFITPHILEPGQNPLLPYDFENQQALGINVGVPETAEAGALKNLLPGASGMNEVKSDQ